MTVRFSALAPINDPASLYKPIRKVVHRAHPEIPVTRGTTLLVDSPFRATARMVPDRGLPLPASVRSPSASTRRVSRATRGSTSRGPRPPTTRRCSRRSRTARSADYYGAQVVDDAEVERGVAPGDSSSTRGCVTRSDGSRRGALEFPTPTLVDEATYAVEAAVLGEADVVRLQRRLDTLEERLASIELRLPNRIYRKVAGAGEARARR